MLALLYLLQHSFLTVFPPKRAREENLLVRMSVRQFDLRLERSWLWKQSKHFMCDCESLEVITILALSGKTCIYTHRDINKQPGHMLSQLKITNTFTPCIWTVLRVKPTGLPFYGWILLILLIYYSQHTRKLQKLAYFTWKTSCNFNRLNESVPHETIW